MKKYLILVKHNENNIASFEGPGHILHIIHCENEISALKNLMLMRRYFKITKTAYDIQIYQKTDTEDNYKAF